MRRISVKKWAHFKEPRYPWARFLGGHWTKEFPRRPGRYPVANRQGIFCGFRQVSYHFDGPDDGHPADVYLVDAKQAPGDRETWAGWWWSEPLPALPECPSWDETKE